MMASMAHDLLAGKPIELNGLWGVVRLGKARACATRRRAALPHYGRQVAVPVPDSAHRCIAQALGIPAMDGKPAV